MKNQKIIALRMGAFEVQDFSAKKHYAEITFDDCEEVEIAHFYSTDVMECALGKYISQWDEPHFPDGPYMVYEFGSNGGEDVKVSYPTWWESKSLLEQEKPIKQAIMYGTDCDLKRIENKVFLGETARKFKAA